jgi:tetratricopeptide (TPR) repeat protein
MIKANLPASELNDPTSAVMDRLSSRPAAAAAGRRRRQRSPADAATRRESLYAVAQRHEQRREYDVARRLYLAMATDPDRADGRACLAWGRMEARLGHLGAARRVFARGLRQLPDNTHLAHAWAVEEQRAGNVDDARRLFEYALERDPGDGLVYQAYALLEQQQVPHQASPST